MGQIISYYDTKFDDVHRVHGNLVNGQWQSVEIRGKSLRDREQNLEGERLASAIGVLQAAREKGKQPGLTYLKGNVLDEVITATEAAGMYGISESGIRKACERAYDAGPTTWCRKAGGTWLILRGDADARWGK